MFRLVERQTAASEHAHSDEFLIDLAGREGPVACIWEAAQGLVVPRTYRRFEYFPQACAQSAARGWPVAVRLSGGGIVPQGAGIINLSLAYQADGKPLDGSDQAYLLICRLISRALLPFGIASHAAPVQGSFCDGRYNLAVGQGDTLRKIAGTAQLWRRLPVPGQEHLHTQVVMVHALILAHADIQTVTAEANHFERMLGSDKCYEPDRAASLFDLYTAPGCSAADFLEKFRASLAHCVKQADMADANPQRPR